MSQNPPPVPIPSDLQNIVESLRLQGLLADPNTLPPVIPGGGAGGVIGSIDTSVTVNQQFVENSAAILARQEAERLAQEERDAAQRERDAAAAERARLAEQEPTPPPPPFVAASAEDALDESLRLLENAGASNEAEAASESQDTDDSEVGIFDKAADIAGNAIGLAANTNFGQPRFSDRGVLGEDNIVRDMRYPIDMFDDDGARLPNVISFEFFKKDYKTLKEEATQFATLAAGGLNTVVDITRDVIQQVTGSTLETSDQYSQQVDAIDQAVQAGQQAIIDENLAQGPYRSAFGTPQDEALIRGVAGDAFVDAANLRANLEQVKDVRLNRAREASMDRIFLYVPNNLSFSDTIDYDDASQSATRIFYETGAGNTETLKTALKLGAASVVASKAASAAEAVIGEAAGGLDLYSSMKAKLGLATNPYNELAFKGMARKSFQFTFTFAPTSPKEAVMMQNIIQAFRFHSVPELAESTLLYFAPHETDVKFFRTTLLDEDEAKIQSSVGLESGFDTFGRRASLDTVGGVNVGKVNSRLIENTEIPRIGRCFVSGVSVNYSPQAKSSFFVNGVPSQVEMTLSMSQAITMNKQFVLQGF
jgi:hypothetical protein